MEKEDLQQETVSIKREKKRKQKTHGSRDAGESVCARESLASKDTAPWESFGERESDARH